MLHRRDSRGPFPWPGASLRHWPAPEPSLPDSPAPRREPAPAPPPVRACISPLRRSYAGLLKTGGGLRDLDQPRWPLRCGLIEQLERMTVGIQLEVSARHGQEALYRAEAVDDRRGLIAATDHAVGALGVAAGHAIVFPGGGFEQLLVTLGVALLEQIAGLLPAEDVIGRHAPRRALVIAVAHQEFEKQRRHIELPCGLAVGQNGAEEATHAGPAQESMLVRRLVVAVAGRKHDALDAHSHHFVEEGAHAVGVSAVEEGGVGGDAEAAPDGLLDALNGDVVAALAAN